MNGSVLMETEKRLIDADKLEKLVRDHRATYHHKEDVLAAIAKQPTVDAVEVVRCGECQYAEPYERVDGKTGYYCQHPKNTFQYGTNWERLFEPIKESDDFCSYGERRSDG